MNKTVYCGNPACRDYGKPKEIRALRVEVTTVADQGTVYANLSYTCGVCDLGYEMREMHDDVPGSAALRKDL